MNSKKRQHGKSCSARKGNLPCVPAKGNKMVALQGSAQGRVVPVKVCAECGETV